jgi:hypothetical protein
MSVKIVKRKEAGPKAKSGIKPRPKSRDRLECRVCGYRVIVDEACGCVEEHVLLCCGRPMAKVPGA